jgi:hypothetical protein
MLKFTVTWDILMLKLASTKSQGADVQSVHPTSWTGSFRAPRRARDGSSLRESCALLTLGTKTCLEYTIQT